MRRRLILVWSLSAAAAFCAVSAGASSAQTAPPSPAGEATNPPIPSPKPAAEDPRVRKLAVAQFLAWQTGNVDRSLYGDRVNAELTDDLLDRGTKTLANLGGLQKATFEGISAAKGANLYVYRMTCENGTIDMDFALSPEGKITLIFFQ
jgi:hypothetical protein